MIALPNYTCYKVLDSFGVELPFEVIDVDVVKFDLPNVDRYSRYGVMVNCKWSKLLIEMANISGSWRQIGMAKSDAYNTVETINNKAERFKSIQQHLKTMTKTVKNRTVKISNDEVYRLVKEYNSIIDLFANYSIDLAKKIEFDFTTNSIRILRK